MLQLGLPHPLGRESSQSFSTLRNVSERIGGQQTPYLLRRDADLGGSLALAGPSSSANLEQEKGAIQTFAPRARRGIFAGCHLHSGGFPEGFFKEIGTMEVGLPAESVEALVSANLETLVAPHLALTSMERGGERPLRLGDRERRGRRHFRQA